MKIFKKYKNTEYFYPLLILILKSIYQNMKEVQPYRNGKIRFLLLFLASMTVFSNHYSFNNPQALESYMIQDLNISIAQFQLLYTVFALPNIITTFFFGYFVDYFGVKISLIIFSVAILVFQVMVAIGGYVYSYIVILIGRLLFGLASGGLISSLAAILTFWFKGKQLSFAFGIAVCLPQLGNALNGAVSPLIYEASNLGTALMVSAGICVVSLGCGAGAAWLDVKADQYDKANNIVQEGDQQQQRIKCSDLKQFQGPFWLVTLVNMFAVAVYTPFLNGATGLLQTRFCYSQVTASRALILTYVVAAICSPPLGYVIDRVGYKRFFILLCALLFLLTQLMLLFWPQCNQGQELGTLAALIIFGLGYCLYGNCVVPSLSLVIKKKVTGTGFGIVQSVQFLALAVFPIINGAIIDAQPTMQDGYYFSSILFVAIGVGGVVCSAALYCLPVKIGQKFDKIGTQDQQEQEDQTVSQQNLGKAKLITSAQIEITHTKVNKHKTQRESQNFKTSLLAGTM